MTSTMESHNTMQEASDQQARCKKQQKTRRMPRAHSNLHTPTCTPQLNLHFDSAKHAYVTNNRSKAEPEILSLRCCRGNCVFSRQARGSQATRDKHPTVPRTTSTKGFTRWLPTAICLEAIAAAHDEAARRMVIDRHNCSTVCPTASHYSEPLLPGGTNPASLQRQAAACCTPTLRHLALRGRVALPNRVQENNIPDALRPPNVL